MRCVVIAGAVWSALWLAGCPYSVVAEGFDARPPGRDAAVADAAAADGAAIDRAGADRQQPDQLPVECDQDNDTYQSVACGGGDCDDNDSSVHPGAAERCSFVDENCDQQNNEGLDCTFVACGSSVLYRIDPFRQTVTQSTQVTLPDSHGLLDIDIDTNGQLMAVTANGLYAVSSSGQMSLVANVTTPTNTNGMAIDSHGAIFITNKDGVNSGAYTVDRATGSLTLIGDLTPYVSSGDCVQTKDDSLYMTAPNPADMSKDLLVYVDSHTAATHSIGATGFGEVYGLSASFGFLFGVTDFGDVIEIDRSTGAGRLLFHSSGLRFWGAANGD
ncbi:MAG: hypothetical protein JXR83_00210 [Deltaproteobacteria bacterium]|nr:hypothetical protein [Deltaproteobacteria bacterium]